MSVSIDWISKVITIPQLYLEDKGGGIYELDIDAFRLDLRDLEDGEEGIVFLPTHQHNAEVVLSGTTYARMILLINGYTITFEDGQYAVNAKGANSNIADVMNVNQVSLRSFNAAGLISITSGSGVTEQDKIDISEKVWDKNTSDHKDDGTFGGEIATKADLQSSASTSEYTVLSGTLNQGTNESGSYTDTYVRDNTYWTIREHAVDGLDVEYTFNIIDDDHAGVFKIFGRYIGTPSLTHYMELWGYNYENTSWEKLQEVFMPGGFTDDAEYEQAYHERHIDRTNNNEVKIKLLHHTTSYNVNHLLYMDSISLTSIEIITAEDIADVVEERLTLGNMAIQPIAATVADGVRNVRIGDLDRVVYKWKLDTDSDWDAPRKTATHYAWYQAPGDGQPIMKEDG